MKSSAFLFVFTGIICGTLVSQASAQDYENTKPAKMTATIEAGQIVHGYNADADAEYNMQAIQKTNLWINQEATLTDHTDVKMGLFASFFYVLPEVVGAPHTRLGKFALFPTNAYLDYHTGEKSNSLWDVRVGLFPFKYNPEASNLGEYLLRSGTYPGYLTTGGFNMINSAGYTAQGIGVTLNLMNGKFKNDFLFPMERNFPPMHSISPTWVGTFKGLAGLDIGAGITCNHCISAKPSNESPKPHEANTEPAYMRWPTSYITEVHHADPTNPLDSSYVRRDTTKFYTYQGVKLMGRATYDLKTLMQSDMFNPVDMKIFVEAAVLGVKNHPYYYDDITRRIPIMFGMNLPTNKLLDLLSIQGEYYNSIFPNDFYTATEILIPMWNTGDPLDTNAQAGPDSPTWKGNRGKWKWSVLAKKEINHGARVYLQVANDHTRPYDYNIKPSKAPFTVGPSDWYYLFRLEIGVF